MMYEGDLVYYEQDRSRIYCLVALKETSIGHLSSLRGVWDADWVYAVNNVRSRGYMDEEDCCLAVPKEML